jgi:hypothetical protein
MRPNTPHYVLGIEDTIVHGRHFYASSTISDTCFAIVHTFVINDEITNQNHDHTRTHIRRLLTMWISHYMQDNDDDGEFPLKLRQAIY